MEIFLVHCIRLVLLDPWPGFVGDQCEEKCGKEDMKVVRRATKNKSIQDEDVFGGSSCPSGGVDVEDERWWRG